MSFIGAKVNVRGAVQGVGFRYYCIKKASGYDIAGYVANLPDGSVELEIEGDRGIVEEYLKEVKIGPTYSHVAEMNVKWYNVPKGYKRFEVKY